MKPISPMTPEQVAAMEAGLKQHFAGDPVGLRCLRRAYAAARGDYALMVAQGTIPPGSAAFLSASMTGLEAKGALLAYFRHLVDRGVAAHERDMDDAEQEVCYEIAHMLDAGTSPERIEEVALSVSYPLTPGQVRWIIRREKAWWLRLNVVLNEAEAMADAA